MMISLVPSQVYRHSPSFSSPPIVDVSQHDHDSVGHSLLDKSSSHVRLVLQNANGFSRENDMFEFQLALENMNSVSADVILFSETNIHLSDYQILQSTNRHCRNTFQYYKQVSSHSTLVYDTRYQPGGTSSIITDNLVG